MVKSTTEINGDPIEPPPVLVATARQWRLDEPYNEASARWWSALGPDVSPTRRVSVVRDDLRTTGRREHRYRTRHLALIDSNPPVAASAEDDAMAQLAVLELVRMFPPALWPVAVRIAEGDSVRAALIGEHRSTATWSRAVRSIRPKVAS